VDERWFRVALFLLLGPSLAILLWILTADWLVALAGLSIYPFDVLAVISLAD